MDNNRSFDMHDFTIAACRSKVIGLFLKNAAMGIAALGDGSDASSLAMLGLSSQINMQLRDAP